MSAAECMEAIKLQFTRFDHNTAAMFERIFDLIRVSSDHGKDKLDGTDMMQLGFHLHSFARLQWPTSDFNNIDIFESFYQSAWACPGMPQLLHFTDLRSSTYRQLMKSYPEGRPTFDDEEEEEEFDLKYDHDSDLTGEYASWFIIGFLVRSCVWGHLSCASNHDGRGHLRDTDYSKAAMLRLARLFSSKMLRNSAKKALYPVAGLMLNIAEKKPKEFLELIEIGVGPAILEWADEDYGKDSLEIMTRLDLSKVSDHMKLDLLEICLNTFSRTPAYPWNSFMDQRKDGRLVKLCLKLVFNLFKTTSDLKGILEIGLKRRPELVKHQWCAKYGRVRIPIAFVYVKLLSGQNLLLKSSLESMLQEFGELRIYDKIGYAEKVLEENEYRLYIKMADDLKIFQQHLKKTKKM